MARRARSAGAFVICDVPGGSCVNTTRGHSHVFYSDSCFGSAGPPAAAPGDGRATPGETPEVTTPEPEEASHDRP